MADCSSISNAILMRAVRFLGIRWASVVVGSASYSALETPHGLQYSSSQGIDSEIFGRVRWEKQTRILNHLDPPESKVFLAEYLTRVPHSPDNWSEGERAVVPIVTSENNLVAVMLLVAPPK